MALIHGIARIVGARSYDSDEAQGAIRKIRALLKAHGVKVAE